VSNSVLIVDDEADFRQQATRLLSMRGFRVVAEAADGAEAVRAARALEPGAVLLDVNLPDRSGLDVARELAALPRSPRVLLTSADAEVSSEDLLACGALGFVAKDVLPASDLRVLFGEQDGAGGSA
jgi:DNA-binding NarL/FixJ family response regulator